MTKILLFTKDAVSELDYHARPYFRDDFANEIRKYLGYVPVYIDFTDLAMFIGL